MIGSRTQLGCRGPVSTVLPAEFQVLPCFAPLPADIVLGKDVPVTLRNGVTIYTGILRPPTTDMPPFFSCRSRKPSLFKIRIVIVDSTGMAPTSPAGH